MIGGVIFNPKEDHAGTSRCSHPWIYSRQGKKKSPNPFVKCKSPRCFPGGGKRDGGRPIPPGMEQIWEMFLLWHNPLLLCSSVPQFPQPGAGRGHKERGGNPAGPPRLALPAGWNLLLVQPGMLLEGMQSFGFPTFPAPLPAPALPRGKAGAMLWFEGEKPRGFPSPWRLQESPGSLENNVPAAPGAGAGTGAMSPLRVTLGVPSKARGWDHPEPDFPVL